MKNELSKEYLDLYEAYLKWQKPRSKGQGFTTVKNRSLIFLKYLEENNINPSFISIQDALEYKAYIAGELTKEGMPIKAGTCCTRLKTARSFCNFLVLTGEIDNNPFLAINYPRIPEKISRNVLNIEEMAVLLKHFRNFNSKETYRTHVLAELLYSTGMRISEAASLQVEDINIKRKVVTIRHGKGDKDRIAFLTGYAASVLAHYLKYLKMHGKSKKLFDLSFSGLQESINNELEKACKKLEIPVITSHGFRHSLGTHLLKKGCDIRHIQVILGHEKLASTQIYTHVAKDEVKESLDNHHPRKWKQEGLV